MIKDDYREETNRDVYDNSERGTYCDDYVRWLENKLQLMQTDKKVISIIEDLIFEDINQEDYWKAVKEAKDLIKKVKAKQLILHIVSNSEA